MKEAVRQGQKMIFQFLKKRMKEKNITQKDLCEKLNISKTSWIRYMKQESPMPLPIYLEACGILELRPYLISAEHDQNEMERMFFN